MDSRPNSHNDDRVSSAVDCQVGHALRQQRLARGLSVATVAQALLVPDASVAAWESGAERIPALHLLSMSRLLSCPLSAFFEGLTAEAWTDPGSSLDQDLVDNHTDRFIRRWDAVKN